VVADDLDHRLDGVGRLDGAQQRPGDAEPVHGDGLGEPFAEAGRGAGPLLVEATGDRLEFTLGGGGVFQRPGGTQPALGQRPLDLGQVIEDVAFLVAFMPNSA